MEVTGLEPVTPCMPCKCSSQLSYTPQIPNSTKTKLPRIGKLWFGEGTILPKPRLGESYMFNMKILKDNGKIVNCLSSDEPGRSPEQRAKHRGHD